MKQKNMGPEFIFRTKGSADDFLKKLNRLAYNVGWITVNDILRDQHLPVTAGGGDAGYSKKDLRKIKPEKDGDSWKVIFPEPGKLVRDIHGYWTVEKQKEE